MAWQKAADGVYRGISIEIEKSHQIKDSLFVKQIKRASLVDRPIEGDDVFRRATPAAMDERTRRHNAEAAVRRTQQAGAPAKETTPKVTHAQVDPLRRIQAANAPAKKPQANVAQAEVGNQSGRDAEVALHPLDVTRTAVADVMRKGPQPLEFK